MTTIKGRLDHIIYQGDDDWVVAVLYHNRAEVRVNGTIIDAQLGDNISLIGDWDNHRKYGRQFKFHSCIVLTPSTAEGVIGFLESRLTHVGRARAIAIVNYFGAHNVFDILLHETLHERLVEIPGITKDRALLIHLEYTKLQNQSDTIVFLKQFLLTDNQVAKILKRYKEQTRAIVESNPYQLISDIHGFGFKIVDEFAIRMGIGRESIQRARAGCVYILQVARNEGNTYIPSADYRRQVLTELNMPTERIDEAITELETEKKIVIENDRVYDAYLHGLECSVADSLIALART